MQCGTREREIRGRLPSGVAALGFHQQRPCCGLPREGIAERAFCVGEGDYQRLTAALAACDDSCAGCAEIIQPVRDVVVGFRIKADLKRCLVLRR